MLRLQNNKKRNEIRINVFGTTTRHTNHVYEFTEAWQSKDENIINQHIDIPTISLQLKAQNKKLINTRQQKQEIR